MSSGRLSANDVELIYPANNGPRCEWFSIKQDKQTKQVRILYNTIDDVYFNVVHEVNVNNRTKTISCLNSRGEDVNACPMCKAGYQQKVLLYIPILDLSDNKIKIWVRSRGFLSQIQGLMMRNNPLSGTIFEIMRNGAPRDPKTTYMFQPVTMNDGTTVEMILQQMNTSLPDQSTYMEVYDYNQMNTYTQNLENIQGNIPANRGAYNQPAYQNIGYAAQPMQTNSYYSNPVQPQVQPTALSQGNYVPQPVAQMPNNVPVRRPATPPPAPAPTQPMVPPSAPYAAAAPNNAPPVPPMVNVAPVETDDDLPF